MKTYTISYQYTIVGHATVEAKNLEQAVDIASHHSPTPLPNDIENWHSNIPKVNLSYLSESFEIHEDDLDIVNDLNEDVERLIDEEVERLNNCNLIQD